MTSPIYLGLMELSICCSALLSVGSYLASIPLKTEITTNLFQCSEEKVTVNGISHPSDRVDDPDDMIIYNSLIIGE